MRSPVHIDTDMTTGTQKLPMLDKNVCVAWGMVFFSFKHLFQRDWEGDRELTFGMTRSQFPDVQNDFSHLFMSLSGENMLYSLMKYLAALDKKVKTVKCQWNQLFLPWYFRNHLNKNKHYFRSQANRLYIGRLCKDTSSQTHLESIFAAEVSNVFL